MLCCCLQPPARLVPGAEEVQTVAPLGQVFQEELELDVGGSGSARSLLDAELPASGGGADSRGEGEKRPGNWAQSPSRSTFGSFGSTTTPSEPKSGWTTPTCAASPTGVRLRCSLSRQQLTLCSPEEILYDVRTHLDTTHDYLAAERLLAEFRRRASAQEWAEFQETELYLRFSARLEQFYNIGRMCCLETDEWQVALEDQSRGLRFECMQSRHDRSSVLFRARLVVPTKIATAVAVANELHLLPKWNSFLSSPPERLGPTSPFSAVVNYQMSLFGGWCKFDVLSEVRRFVDPEVGFLAEAVDPVPAGHSLHRGPKARHARLDSRLARLWVAVGSEETVLVQAGRMRLPVAMHQSVTIALARTAVRGLLAAYRRRAETAGQPGSPWESALQADEHGLYALLDRCAHSPWSLRRAASPLDPASGRASPGAALRPADLKSLFSQTPCSLRRAPATPEPDASDDRFAMSVDSVGSARSKSSLASDGKRGPRAARVSIGPDVEIRCIPDRAGHKEEYRFLAEQHANLKHAVSMTKRPGTDDDNVTEESRVAKSRVELNPAGIDVKASGADLSQA
uniref:START domain-containing protein n=1 Tax=Zooxanthella nutricula TaxID=1333877 RepID=A0A7S2L2M0_9DINO|mmetsp:Transcript_55686/g.169440  ORF Transcript_55686/g.169440 Transcript_55686/m.169440 type:complete len:570 (+) Transcript_55686:3-1712(+)